MVVKYGVGEESFVQRCKSGAALCWKWADPVCKTFRWHAWHFVTCMVGGGSSDLWCCTFVVKFTLTYMELPTGAQELKLTLYRPHAEALRFGLKFDTRLCYVVSWSAVDNGWRVSIEYRYRAPLSFTAILCWQTKRLVVLFRISEGDYL